MQRFKYPRTKHHPISKSVTDDDKVLSKLELESLYGEEYSASIKMDGECTTIYPDGYTHARSIDSKHHSSRDWLKRLSGEVSHLIPKGLRICGENLYARHSIAYTDLPSYFLGFSVWKDDICMSVDYGLAVMRGMGIIPVNHIWRGVLSEKVIQELVSQLDPETTEGLVFRPTSTISMEEFPSKVFKVVRPNHVQTDTHWMNKEVVPNAILK